MARHSIALALALGLALAGVCLPASARGEPQTGGQPALDALLASYMSGKTDVVARTFATSSDFQKARLGNPSRLDRWLGSTWHRGKAAMLLELANEATAEAPQYVRLLVGAGRRFLLTSRATEAANGSDEAFVRLWHRIATGLLLGTGTPAMVEEYVDGVIGQPESPTVGDAVDARLLLSRAVAHEGRCWNLRPDKDRPGAGLRNLARAAGDDLPGPGDLTSSPRALEATRWHTCLGEAIRRFEAAGEFDDTRAEARVRSAWLLFQQGDAQHAFEWLDAATIGDDDDLAYWASLFRGRVLDALGRYQDAADAYAAALASHPGAQSASVGLALALLRLDRADEADELARSLRGRTTAVADPWWAYPEADRRFVDRWLVELRAAVR